MAEVDVSVANGANGNGVHNSGSNGSKRARDHYSPADRQWMESIIFNAGSFRDQFFNRFFAPDPGDIDEKCHYPRTQALNDPWYFRELYDREPIATRVVQLMPRECWQTAPLMYESEDPEEETPFERAWDALGQRLRGESCWYGQTDGSPIWEYLQRADTLSGIGYFGVILIGIDDGRNLDQPADGVMTLNPITNRMWPSRPRRLHILGNSDKEEDREAATFEIPDGSLPLTNGRPQMMTVNYADTELTPAGNSPLLVPVVNARGTVDFIREADARKMVANGEMVVNTVQDADGIQRAVRRQSVYNEHVENQLTANAPFGVTKPARDGGMGPNQGRNDPDYSRARTRVSQSANPSRGSAGDPLFPGGGLGTPIESQGGMGGGPSAGGEAKSAFQDATTAAWPTSFAGAQGTDAQYVGVELSPPEYPSAEPAQEQRQLLFLRVFDEALVQIVQYEADVRNPRFGMPVMYRITLNDPSTQHSGIGLPLATVRVHWSRVIHLADNLQSSEIFGVPRQRPVLNPILDIRKIRGAGAEGYWKSCFTGLALSTHPQLGGDVSVDEEKTKQMLHEYFEGLNRALVLMGMQAQTLAPMVIDPTPHIAINIEAICIQLGCPIRVFKGSERGELASSQDDSSWNDRVRGRRVGYVTPKVIVPFADRMISLGVLPQPGKHKRAAQAQAQSGIQNANYGMGRVGNGRASDVVRWLHPDGAYRTEIKGSVFGRRVAINVANAKRRGLIWNAGDEENQPRADEVETGTKVTSPTGYSIEWMDIDSETRKDKAGYAFTMSQAFSAYINGNVSTMVPPLHFMTDIAGIPDEQARQMIQDAQNQTAEFQQAQMDSQGWGQGGEDEGDEGGDQFGGGGGGDYPPPGGGSRTQQDEEAGGGASVDEDEDREEEDETQNFLDIGAVPIENAPVDWATTSDSQRRAIFESIGGGGSPTAGMGRELGAKLAGAKRDMTPQTPPSEEKPDEGKPDKGQPSVKGGPPPGPPQSAAPKVDPAVSQVKAAVMGTRIGVSKGPAEDREAARRSSDAALKESKTAAEQDTPEAHAGAAQQHRRAAVAMREVGNDEVAGKHDAMAGYHEEMAGRQHGDKVEKARKDLEKSHKEAMRGIPSEGGERGPAELGHVGHEGHGEGHHAAHAIEEVGEHAHLGTEVHEIHEEVHEAHEAAEAAREAHEAGGHFPELAHESAAEHARGWPELAQEHGHEVGGHGGIPHSVIDASALLAGAHLPSTVKMMTGLMKKTPGLKVAGGTIADLHEKATSIGDKTVKWMEERYGHATTAAILTSGVFTTGMAAKFADFVVPGTSTAVKLVPGRARQLVGAIPYVIMAEGAKRAGYIGHGSKVEKSLSGVGTLLHGLMTAAGRPFHYAKEKIGKAGLKAARAAGRAAARGMPVGKPPRGSEEYTGNVDVEAAAKEVLARLQEAWADILEKAGPKVRQAIEAIDRAAENQGGGGGAAQTTQNAVDRSAPTPSPWQSKGYGLMGASPGFEPAGSEGEQVPRQQLGSAEDVDEASERPFPRQPAGSPSSLYVGGRPGSPRTETDDEEPRANRLIQNEFCPTGQGGGVDPSCGKGGEPKKLDLPVSNAKVEQRHESRADRFVWQEGDFSVEPPEPNQNSGGGADDLSGGHWEERDGRFVYVRPGKMTTDDIIDAADLSEKTQNWAGGDGLGPTSQGGDRADYIEPDDGSGRDLSGQPSEDDRLQQPDVDSTSRPTPQPSSAQRQHTPGDDQRPVRKRRRPGYGSGMGGGTT